MTERSEHGERRARTSRRERAAVLIAESSLRLGPVLEAIVQAELGCSTRWLHTSSEARRAADDPQAPVLVIAELEGCFPETLDMIRYWRQRQPQVPVIATGYGDSSSLARELGCVFLGRPFPFEQFLDALKQANGAAGCASRAARYRRTIPFFTA